MDNAMNEEMNVELVSPAKSLAKVKATKLSVPGRDGYIGILPGHAALVTELGLGELTVEGPSIQPTSFLVYGGYLEVVNDQVIVLLDAAESKTDIDLVRAEKALKRATERLTSKDPSIDIIRAQLAQARAHARVRFAK